MSNPTLSIGKRKLVRVLVGEIWVLANGGLDEGHTAKRLERLSAAAMQLQKQITTNPPNDPEQSLPVCLAIKEEIDELIRF
jgi:hypothetical protein